MLGCLIHRIWKNSLQMAAQYPLYQAQTNYMSRMGGMGGGGFGGFGSGPNPDGTMSFGNSGFDYGIGQG